MPEIGEQYVTETLGNYLLVLHYHVTTERKYKDQECLFIFRGY